MPPAPVGSDEAPHAALEASRTNVRARRKNMARGLSRAKCERKPATQPASRGPAGAPGYWLFRAMSQKNGRLLGPMRPVERTWVMALSFVAFLQTAANRALASTLRPRVPLRTLVVAALLASTGCGASGERTCTLVDCTDHVEIKLTPPAGSWADGVYELDVRADDQLLGTCTLRLPDQLPTVPGGGFRTQCGQGIDFDFVSKTQCATGQPCPPNPGRFEARLSVAGTLPRVEFSLLRDSQPILVEKAEPAYKDVYPNGPDCPGHCRQATLAYTVP